MKFTKRLSKGFLFAFTMSFLWACLIVTERFILKNGENPLNLAAWIGLVTSIPWLFVFNKHATAFIHLTKRHIFLLIFIGVAGSIGIDYLESLALAHTPAANFAFLYRSIVVFTIVFAWIFFKEKITAQKLFLAFSILVGSFLLITNGKGISLSLGDMYTLLMAISAAFIGNILTKHTVAHMHPDLSGSVTSLVSALTLITLAFATKIATIPHNLPLVLLAGFFALSSTMTRNRAYKHASASFVTMIVSLTPFFVALLSLPLLHEHMELVEIIGGLVIVGSIVFVEYLQI